MLEDMGVADHDPGLQPCQPGGAIAEPAPGLLASQKVPIPRFAREVSICTGTSLDDAALNSTGWKALQSAKSLKKDANTDRRRRAAYRLLLHATTIVPPLSMRRIRCGANG